MLCLPRATDVQFPLNSPTAPVSCLRRSVTDRPVRTPTFDVNQNRCDNSNKKISNNQPELYNVKSEPTKNHPCNEVISSLRRAKTEPSNKSMCYEEYSEARKSSLRRVVTDKSVKYPHAWPLNKTRRTRYYRNYPNIYVTRKPRKLVLQQTNEQPQHYSNRGTNSQLSKNKDDSHKTSTMQRETINSEDQSRNIKKIPSKSPSPRRCSDVNIKLGPSLPRRAITYSSGSPIKTPLAHMPLQQYRKQEPEPRSSPHAQVHKSKRKRPKRKPAHVQNETQIYYRSSAVMVWISEIRCAAVYYNGVISQEIIPQETPSVQYKESNDHEYIKELNNLDNIPSTKINEHTKNLSKRKLMTEKSTNSPPIPPGKIKSTPTKLPKPALHYLTKNKESCYAMNFISIIRITLFCI